MDLDREVVTMDGKRYTESDALADAHGAEQRFSGLNRGGRSLSADGKHSPQVTVTLARETRDIVAQKAALEHMSVSKCRCIRGDARILPVIQQSNPDLSRYLS